MSQPHSYLSLQLPPNTPFELKPSPGKGWGAFATRPIPTNTLILHEPPLFTISKPHASITETDILSALEQLPQHSIEQFVLLRNNGGPRFTHLTHACAENSFSLPPHPSSGGGSAHRHGFFVLLSRLNHACVPNSHIPDTDVERGIISCFATRDIIVGEEITFCYNEDFACRTRGERHRALCFVCACETCEAGAEARELSDMRRRFMRGLHYLTHGEDAVGGLGMEGTGPVIIDAGVRAAAEDFKTPISSRFVYTILIMYLLEREGLMDGFMEARMGPSVEHTAALFATGSNARVARLVVEQETWLGKLRVAARLYGRVDANDAFVAAGLRMIHEAPEMC
ncbi:hypothetical protein VE03_07987 [Pseudogymnoascus sp. 23342-1-I1]|nr:hypothetical protein VE03_07987 [Pseudogymnoascus sp. 23342-1-I1]